MRNLIPNMAFADKMWLRAESNQSGLVPNIANTKFRVYAKLVFFFFGFLPAPAQHLTTMYAQYRTLAS